MAQSLQPYGDTSISSCVGPGQGDGGRKLMAGDKGSEVSESCRDAQRGSQPWGCGKGPASPGRSQVFAHAPQSSACCHGDLSYCRQIQQGCYMTALGLYVKPRINFLSSVFPVHLVKKTRLQVHELGLCFTSSGKKKY